MWWWYLVLIPVGVATLVLTFGVWAHYRYDVRTARWRHWRWDRRLVALFRLSCIAMTDSWIIWILDHAVGNLMIAEVLTAFAFLSFILWHLVPRMMNATEIIRQ